MVVVPTGFLDDAQGEDRARRYFSADSKATMDSFNIDGQSRLDVDITVSYTQISTAARFGNVNFGVYTSDQLGKITYHFRRQLFREIGYGQSTLHKTSVNGRTLLREYDWKIYARCKLFLN